MPKKKCILLIAHNTALKSYLDIFQKIGIGCYFQPSRECPKEESSKDIDPQFLVVDKDLDRFDLYKDDHDEKDLDEIKKIVVNKGYDFLISYHWPPFSINRCFINSGINCFFLIWGGPEKDLFHGYKYGKNQSMHKLITSSSNSQYLLCHSYLSGLFKGDALVESLKTLNIPYSFSEKTNSTWFKTDQENYVLIACSRLNNKNGAKNLNLLKSIFKTCHDVNFVLCGKGNSGLKLGGNVEIFDAPEVSDVLVKMQKAKLFLYFQAVFYPFLSGQILQYSPIEASRVGLPILHCSSNPINAIIETPDSHNFKVSWGDEVYFDYSEIHSKVKRILSLPKRKVLKEFSYQKQLSDNYSIEFLKDSYKSFFLS